MARKRIINGLRGYIAPSDLLDRRACEFADPFNADIGSAPKQVGDNLGEKVFRGLSATMQRQ
jgi:hypothetical protein